MAEQPPPEGQAPLPPEAVTPAKTEGEAAAPVAPAETAAPAAPVEAAAPAVAGEPAVAAAPEAKAAPAEAVAAPSAPEKLAEVAEFESVGGGAASAAPEPETANAAAAAAEPAADPVAQAVAEASAGAGDADAANMENLDVEALLKQANFEDASAVHTNPAADAEPLNLPSFQQVMQDAQVSSIDLLRDVELNVKIELGRNRMLVEDVLKLAEGSVVELDKLAGDPVDVFVNERLVARGEVLVLNDNFCVRVNEIVTGVKEEGL